VGRNPEVLAAAFKNAKRKLASIALHNITPDMSDDEIDTVVLTLSGIKAKSSDLDYSEFISGQEYYVSLLIDFSAMTAEERLTLEYDAAFGDIASEAEMLAQLAG
tara:strand:+ start:478 stop:792 length:315 start_codon:yes stop_codon:yes gene_type:complete